MLVLLVAQSFNTVVGGDDCAAGLVLPWGRTALPDFCRQLLQPDLQVFRSQDSFTIDASEQRWFVVVGHDISAKSK